jgi:dihydroxyacetone kinase phosphoprotein-dependent L subunit
MANQTLNGLNVESVKNMFLYIGEKIIESKDYLGQIDAEIGDGDHGSGMATGAQAFTVKLKDSQFETVNEVFKVTGMEMMKSMGGASGVIFGTMFSAGAKAIEPSETVNNQKLVPMFAEALASIKKRGKAELGDKTMIDALEPAVRSLEADAAEQKPLLEVLKNAEQAAAQGVEDTKNITAKYGRAKTLGDRAIGYQDAGATSVWLIFKSMREWVEQNEA